MRMTGRVPPAVRRSLDERTGIIVAVSQVAIRISPFKTDVEREEVRMLARLGPDLVLEVSYLLNRL